VQPDIIIKDESTVSVDVEAWNFDVPFGSEVEAFKVYRVKEGLYLVSDVGLGVFGERFNSIFYNILCVGALPGFLDHFEDAVIIAHLEAFYGKEEVWPLGV
jgi:hypothetical protein